jgi:hypothetical protein
LWNVTECSCQQLLSARTRSKYNSHLNVKGIRAKWDSIQWKHIKRIESEKKNISRKSTQAPEQYGEKNSPCTVPLKKKELLNMTFSHMDGIKYVPIKLILTPANGRDYQSEISKNQLVWSRFHIRCFRWYCPYDDIQSHG